MAKVLPAKLSDFEKILPLFKHFNRPETEPDFWKRIFLNPWNADEDYIGYMLLDDSDNAVGFLGYLFSERKVNGQMKRFCNLNCWAVEEDYRSFGLSLLKPALMLSNHIITNFTASPRVVEILNQFGFQKKATHISLFPFFANFLNLGGRFSVEFGKNIRENLSEDNKAIFDDHQMGCVKHILFNEGDKSCYVIATRVMLKGFMFLKVQYCSEYSVLQKCLPKLILKLCFQFKVWGVVVESQMLNRNSWAGIKIALPRPLLCLARDVPLESIDTLYSELVVLND